MPGASGSSSEPGVTEPKAGLRQGHDGPGLAMFLEILAEIAISFANEVSVAEPPYVPTDEGSSVTLAGNHVAA